MKRRVDKINQDRSLSSYGSHKKKMNKLSGKMILVLVLSLVLIVVIGVGGVWAYMLGGLDRTEVDNGKISITSEAEATYKDYTLVALYGLDTRENDDTGRSDAIVLACFDSVHNKIKLISFARDSYVEIEKNGKTWHDKLTHAWAYGVSEKKKDTDITRHELALKTLNSNFKLNTSDYVSMNFYQFADVIDYIGGVDIDVSESEKAVMNREYIPALNSSGIKCNYISKTGMQHLSGGQALAYSRNRYTGSDVDRGNRQREVLMAMYEQVKDLNVTKYPTLINKVLDQCQTSLDNGEMMKLATWVAAKKPAFEQLSLPTELHCEMIDGRSYVVYDLDEAAQTIEDFIHEKGAYAPSSSQSASSVASK